MKQYVVDEIRLADHDKIKTYLDKTFGPAEMGSIYWLPVDAELLSDKQKAHVECQPFYLALELEEDRLACELLVRTRNRVRCDCIAYATEHQRNWAVNVVDAVFERLEIHS